MSPTATANNRAGANGTNVKSPITGGKFADVRHGCFKPGKTAEALASKKRGNHRPQAGRNLANIWVSHFASKNARRAVVWFT